MKCMFCPIHSEDSRLLAAHIRSAHADKTTARRLATAVEHKALAPLDPFVRLPIYLVDIDAIHRKYVLRGGLSRKLSVGV